MKSGEFIKEHIINTKRDYSNIGVLAESYKKYSEYLELIQKDEIILLFLFIKKYGCIWRGLAKQMLKVNSFNYYINILESNGFIEVINPPENLAEDLIIHIGEYNYMKIVFYGFSDKGKHFLKLKHVNKYFKTLEGEFEHVL